MFLYNILYDPNKLSNAIKLKKSKLAGLKTYYDK